MSLPDLLAALDSQPHAAAVLGAAMAPGAIPSHAYLFHGPPGSGKRTAARAFAAALLADGAAEHERVAGRVARGTHPDLTWVRPSGASEMLVADIEAPVVAAATRTPFEAARRVFVIEAADTMNDRAANRMLKTLEEPPSYVHIVLLAATITAVIDTIISRCQLIRFDPLPPDQIERRLALSTHSAPDPSASPAPDPSAGPAPDPSASPAPDPSAGPAPDPSAGAATLAACARLCLGDVHLARLLASERGSQLRQAAEAVVEAAISGGPIALSRPWTELLEVAKQAGQDGGKEVAERAKEDLEVLSKSERRRREREATEAGRRAERRRRTEALEVGLRLIELWLRDLLCLANDAGELIHARDRIERLQACYERLGKRRPGSSYGQSGSGAAGSGSMGFGSIGSDGGLAEAIDAVCQTQVALLRNVSADLALEGLAYRLQSLLSG